MIELFLGFLKESLISTANVYYGLKYWETTQEYLSQVYKQDDFKEYLKRYHERVFCYELYHQIRTCMDNVSVSFTNVYLQSEVRKDKLPPAVLDFFEVEENLDKNYMPDFLLHTPGDFSNQFVVMEVKSNPSIDINDIKKDLFKIFEFMDHDKLKYQQGVFLSVNILPKDLFKLVDDNKSLFVFMSEDIRSRILIIAQAIDPKSLKPTWELQGQRTLQSFFDV